MQFIVVTSCVLGIIPLYLIVCKEQQQYIYIFCDPCIQIESRYVFDKKSRLYKIFSRYISVSLLRRTCIIEYYL